MDIYGCASRIIDLLLLPACIKIKNVYNLEHDFSSMKNKWDELNAKQQYIIETLQRQSRQQSAIASQWIENVNSIGNRVKEISNRHEENMSNRFLGCCPDCYGRLNISGDVRNCTEDIESLIEQYKSEKSCFEGPKIRELLANRYIPLKSFEDKKSVMEKALLSDNQVQNIGVWSRKGAGKTTLLTQIYNSDNVRDCFKNTIFWIDCPLSSGGVKSIQKSILKTLDITPNSNSTEDLRNLIFTHLKGKKFLLFLDNFQGRTDLERLNEDSVGLPLAEENYKKVFSCTCKNEKVCENRGVGIYFEMTKLSIEEGQQLFDGRNSTSGKVSTFKECERLPLDIVKLAEPGNLWKKMKIMVRKG